MDAFSQALDYVHSALSDLQARGVPLTVSIATLDSLSALAATETPPAAAPSGEGSSTRLAWNRNETAVSAVPTSPPPAVPTVPRLPSLPVLPRSSPAPASDQAARLAALRDPVLVCTKCEHLVRSRTQVVFGVGNPEAELMFVGEAPGEDEDRQGEPFVGRAGQLLTKIIETMGFSREQVYIANVLKCRPDMPPNSSGNRPPTPAEMSTCLPYLEQQIQIIQPRVIVALGTTAMRGLTQTEEPMGRLRGRWHEFRGIPLMATYHPSYLLRSQALSEKRKVWEDMLLVLEKLGLPITDKQKAYFLAKG